MFEKSLCCSRVVDLFLGMKSFLTEFMTLDQEATYDSLFKIDINETTRYLRLKKYAVSESTSAISIQLGTDVDEMLANPIDPEICLPFLTSDGGEVETSLSYGADSEGASLQLFMKHAGPKRYSGSWNLGTGEVLVRHQDHMVPGCEPNFKQTGTPYMPCGV